VSGDVRTDLADRRAAPPLIERASPTDVMELVCDVSGSSMQVAAVLVLETSSALDRPPLDLASHQGGR